MHGQKNIKLSLSVLVSMKFGSKIADICVLCVDNSTFSGGWVIRESRHCLCIVKITGSRQTGYAWSVLTAYLVCTCRRHCIKSGLFILAVPYLQERSCVGGEGWQSINLPVTVVEIISLSSGMFSVTVGT